MSMPARSGHPDRPAPRRRARSGNTARPRRSPARPLARAVRRRRSAHNPLPSGCTTRAAAPTPAAASAIDERREVAKADWTRRSLYGQSRAVRSRTDASRSIRDRAPIGTRKRFQFIAAALSRRAQATSETAIFRGTASSLLRAERLFCTAGKDSHPPTPQNAGARGPRSVDAADAAAKPPRARQVCSEPPPTRREGGAFSRLAGDLPSHA
jgi:hypothetical protein